MKNQINEYKWHKVDEAAAEVLTTLTNSPGVVYPINNSLLPEQIKEMRDVSSYQLIGHPL